MSARNTGVGVEKNGEKMINKLISKIKATNAPIVVGLDPMMKFVPEHIQKKAFRDCGETLEGAAEAIWQYNKEIVDNIYDIIPAVKPQIAMYEQFGIPGLMAFKKTVDYCKEKDLVVIGDIKRGDIGSTSEAYATGHLGKVKVGSKSYYGFDEDFVTVNPYLGSDGVNPFIKVCQEEKKGIFVLVKTSNPSSGEFQDRAIADAQGRPLYEIVGEKVAKWGEEHMGDDYSYIGAVVGARFSAKSCRKAIYWCRATVRRAEKERIWRTSLTRTDSAQLLIPQEASSPLISRKNTRPSVRSASERPHGRLWRI